MPSSMARFRARAFRSQSGRCFYCSCPMWENSAESFIQMYELSRGQAMPLKCTAEHIKARSDGGADSKRNIVAACGTCNRRRHQRKIARSSAEHLGHVQRAMRRGKWHGQWLWTNPSLVAAFNEKMP